MAAPRDRGWATPRVVQKGEQYRRASGPRKPILEFGPAGTHPARVSRRAERGDDAALGSAGRRDRSECGEPPEVVQGVVERVTFHADDSLYTVLKLKAERGYGDNTSTLWPLDGKLTAVGRAPRPGEGLRVRLRGRWGRHPSHGRQFEFETLEVLRPLGIEGLVRYLSSKAFKGIGPVLARRIADALGHDALAVIRDHPERLEGIEGLGERARAELVRGVRAELDTHQVRAFLMGLGLGPWQVDLLLRHHAEATERRVRADPYAAAREVTGIGFATADRVARELGFAATSPERLRAGLLHAMRRAADDGHSLLPRTSLVEAAREVLGEEVGAEELEAALEREAGAGELIVDRPGGDGAREGVYLPMYHTCEVGLARNLEALLARGDAPALGSADRLAEAEARAGLELHELQREAVLGLLRHPVALLTGGPGVGKTTIVRLVVELAERARARVRLASPTGRAAKRLAEATGRDASTIHRLLGYDPQRGGFACHADNPLDADLVVVDELSMLDLVLAHHLVKAVQPPTRLVLVGDPDQLPAVGAGNVLGDLLASERVPAWRLTRIYRQRAESRIVRNAHHVLAGEPLELPGRDEPPSDFYFFTAPDEHAAAERLVEVVTERIPRRFGLDWMRDVQVLAPMYRGACGVDALNRRLRDALGTGRFEARRGERVWREGDRVIHTRNDYEKEVFNGDTGRITRIEPDGSGLVVRFPERDLHYAPSEFTDLQPAFAITVHRAQGGEYPAVVVPLVTQHFPMLQRHLLYTAVTRARTLVVLVGSPRALELALANADQARRESGLAERLRAAAPG